LTCCSFLTDLPCENVQVQIHCVKLGSQDWDNLTWFNA
jgi:hypothetical protein